MSCRGDLGGPARLLRQSWTHVPEGGVDYSRLQYVLDYLEPGEYVLDSGCGPGFLAGMLRDAGMNVVGTDVSRVGPERTRARGIDAEQVDRDTVPPVCRRHVRRGDRQLQSRASLLHATTRPGARAVRPAGRKVRLARPEHRALAPPHLAARRPFPVCRDSPTDEYHIRYVTAYEGKKLLREAQGSNRSSCAGNAGTWVRGLYPRIPGEPLHEAHVRPLVRASRTPPSVLVRTLSVFLRGETHNEDRTS